MRGSPGLGSGSLKGCCFEDCPPRPFEPAQDSGSPDLAVSPTLVRMAETINTLSVVTIVISGLVLLLGVYLIKSGRREAHMKAMLTASTLATLFLVLYLTRLGLGYEKKYVGPNKTAYLALLVSHIILAAANLPLALLALWNGWKGYVASGRNLGNIDSPEARPFFARHRMWVKWTVPVWLYVAVTGWIIYLLLHNHGEVIKGA